MNLQENTLPRVVVAEDEAIIRLDIVQTLTENGFECVGQANDGAEAVRLALELKPDLVLMDIKMPGTDGLQAAELLREHDLPVVLLTAFSSPDLVDRASAAGVYNYVVKRISRAASEVEEMTEKLESRKVVDRAKALLTEKMKMNEPEAFRWIQKASMDRRLTMRQVAETVIEQLGEKN
jgi:AmiR/NasT family two-component response regulator